MKLHLGFKKLIMTLRFDLPAKVIPMTGPHPECQRRICTRNEGAGKASS